MNTDEFLQETIIRLKELQRCCLKIVQNGNFVDYENDKILDIIPSVQNLIEDVEHLTEIPYTDDEENDF